MDGWKKISPYHLRKKKKNERKENNVSKKETTVKQQQQYQKEIDEHTLYLNDNIFFNILCID